LTPPRGYIFSIYISPYRLYETVVAANDPEYYDALSLYLNALSNPTRLKVLEALDVAEVAYQPDS
jgi:hypothetical protein